MYNWKYKYKIGAGMLAVWYLMVQGMVKNGRD
jgi:hypothetical protein